MNNFMLDEVIVGLNDLGNNRLPFSISVRIHNIKKKFMELLRDRDLLKNELMKPYDLDKDGKVNKDDEGYEELKGKIEQLWNEEITVDFGDSINIEKLLELKTTPSIVIKEESISVLMEAGILV